jgi:nucleoside-diphosphate-sugar epimerase
MVIGNGLLANTFIKYEDSDDIIIFASGVSNSKEINEYEFKREFDLLKTMLVFKETKKIIYFSTCSVLDISLSESNYIKHKKNIEEFIKSNFKYYLILRIPNIVSNTKNSNTSFNFFKNKLLNNDEIICNKYATRYYIDIDDLVKTLPIFIETYVNQSINICFNNKETVINFIFKMGKILKVNPKIKLVDNGTDYTIDNSVFISILDDINYSIGDDYNNKIIEKYI